jgi:isoaspartyl peptidase/L-asparaginase-like protein (Ntn-hydrolase superfamily)
MKIVMAKSAVEMLRSAKSPSAGAAQRAADDAVQLLAARGRSTGGLILLDREGTPAAAFNTPRMAWGSVQGDGKFFVNA